MLKIFDNHIPERIRERLIHDEEYAYTPMGEYFFWEVDNFNKPNSPIEDTLRHIWKDVINPYEYSGGVIKYWINKSEGLSKGIWHVDFDGELSAVYYTKIDCLGGYLELCDNENSLSQQEFKDYIKGLDPQTQVQRIQPITNRAVIYDSHKIHRVSKTYNGIRECLASTIYHKKPVDF